MSQKCHVVTVRDSGSVTAAVVNVAGACSTAGHSRAFQITDVSVARSGDSAAAVALEFARTSCRDF